MRNFLGAVARGAGRVFSLRWMRSRLVSSLVVIVALTGLLLGLSVWQGNSPLLGLDLQGGIEVVLRPSEDQSYTSDDIDLATTIIRRRVDALGVAEPDITRQSNDVVVQIPGVEDQDRAIELVGQTAELTFRPALMSPQVYTSSTPQNQEWLNTVLVACGIREPDEADGTGGDGDGTDGDGADADGSGVTTTTVAPGPVQGPVLPDTTAPSDAGSDGGETDAETNGATESSTDTSEQSAPALAPVRLAGQSASPGIVRIQDTTEPDATTTTQPDAPATTTTAPTDSSAPTTPTSIIPVVPAPAPVPNEAGLDQLLGVEGEGLRLCDLFNGEPDDPREVQPDDVVVFPDDNGFLYLLGPTQLTGAGIESAEAVLTGISAWTVSLVMKSGAEGIDQFNALAADCNAGIGNCRTMQLAIALDGVVESAPTAEAAAFERDQIVISGNFTEREARDLELVLRYGALPVEFDDPAESGLIRTVSATLGRDSLNAGIIAGIVGIALVAIYILIYYRLLGLMALLSLMLSGTLLWIVVSFLSETTGLALTLAGITGLIVSLGVSLDSNVVYFENLKEGVRNGRTVLSSVSQSFPVAFKTIFWANFATLIGAGVLWFLTVGSVKGFAAMLAIASILDLVATYFFLRPSVRLLADAKMVKANSKLLGIPPDIALEPAAVGAAAKSSQPELTESSTSDDPALNDQSAASQSDSDQPDSLVSAADQN